jgi:hypothetical protein
MTRMKEARGQIELLRYELPAASVPVSWYGTGSPNNYNLHKGRPDVQVKNYPTFKKTGVSAALPDVDGLAAVADARAECECVISCIGMLLPGLIQVIANSRPI